MSDAQRNAVVAWMAKYAGQFTYTNDARRTNPLKYYATDCSGSIRQAYLDCTGVNIGLRSYNIAENAAGATVANCSTWAALPVDKMLPGDVLCMAFPYGTFAGRISHVEMYAGRVNGVPMTWGHGGPGKGPNLHRLDAKYITGSASKIIVKRFIFDRVTTAATAAESEDDELTQDEKNKLDFLYNAIKVSGQPFGYPEASHNAIGKLIERVDRIEAKLEGK